MLRLILRVIPGLALATLLVVPAAMQAGRLLSGHVLAYSAFSEPYTDIALLDWRTRVRWHTGTPGEDMQPVWSSDGRRLAFISAQSRESRFVIVEPGEPLRHMSPLDLPLPHMIYEMDALWHEDDTTLLYMPPAANRNSNGQPPVYRVNIEVGVAWQIDIDSDAVQSFFERLSQLRQGIVASPDGRYTLFIRYEDGHWILYRHDTQEDSETRVYDSGTINQIFSYTLSPDGRYAAAAVSRPPQSGIIVFDLHTGMRHEIDGAGGLSPAWQP